MKLILNKMLFRMALIAIPLMATVGCKKVDPEIFKEEAFFRLTEELVGAPLGESTFVPIAFTKVNGESGTVTVSGESADLVEGVDFVIVNPVVSFDADEFVKNVEVIIIDNGEDIGGSEIILKIVSATGGLPGIPYDDTRPETVIQVTCPLDFDRFDVEYDGFEIGYGAFDPVIAVFDYDDFILEVGNLGDWGFPGPAYLTLDPNSNVVTISGVGFPGSPIGDLFWVGTGTYNACNGVIQVTYRLVTAAGGQVSLGGAAVTGVNIFTPA
jgi:hypothetical protein